MPEPEPLALCGVEAEIGNNVSINFVGIVVGDVFKNDISVHLGYGNLTVVGFNVGGTDDFGKRMYRLFARRHCGIDVDEC